VFDVRDSRYFETSDVTSPKYHIYIAMDCLNSWFGTNTCTRGVFRWFYSPAHEDWDKPDFGGDYTEGAVFSHTQLLKIVLVCLHMLLKPSSAVF